MKSLFYLLVCLFIVTGCSLSGNLPEYHGENFGIAAIPLKLNSQGGQIVFDYYFTIKKVTSGEESTISTKGLKKPFTYSDQLAIGNYQITNIITQYRNTVGVRASKNRSITPLKNPVPFSISKGQITMIPWVFEVTHKKIETHKWNTSWRFHKLKTNTVSSRQNALNSLIASTGWSANENSGDQSIPNSVSPTAPDKQHEIKIDSSPQSAEVFIDNLFAGYTPVTTKLGGGYHELELDKQGYEKLQKRLYVAPDNEVFHYSLKTKSSAVTFSTNIAKSAVYLDQEFKGLSPITLDLSPGEYRVSFRKDGYKTLQEHITVTTKTTAVSRSLSPIKIVSAQTQVKPQKVLATSLETDTPKVLAKKVALVIGNEKYSISPLANPVNDANDIAATLKKLNFEVIIKKNADRRTMLEAMDSFYQRLRKAEIGFFYYAGHGIQMDGKNYLIPINAFVKSESEVDYEAVPAGRILGKMKDAGNKLNIVVLDACRNNPFRSMFRSQNQGLALMNTPDGTIVVYSTSPGKVAMDGIGRNGVYTKYLLENLNKQDLSIWHIFNKTGLDVKKATNGKQTPWMTSTPLDNFYF